MKRKVIVYAAMFLLANQCLACIREDQRPSTSEDATRLVQEIATNVKESDLLQQCFATEDGWLELRFQEEGKVEIVDQLRVEEILISSIHNVSDYKAVYPFEIVGDELVIDLMDNINEGKLYFNISDDGSEISFEKEKSAVVYYPYRGEIRNHAAKYIDGMKMNRKPLDTVQFHQKIVVKTEGSYTSEDGSISIAFSEKGQAFIEDKNAKTEYSQIENFYECVSEEDVFISLSPNIEAGLIHFRVSEDGKSIEYVASSGISKIMSNIESGYTLIWTEK